MPVLAPGGLIAGGLAALFIALGAVTASWPLFALGVLQFATLLVLFVLFIPQSAMLRRDRLEFAWWIPSTTSHGSLKDGQLATLHIMLRNRANASFARARLHIICASQIRIGDGAERPIDVALPARCEIDLQVAVTPQAAGYWAFHGVRLIVEDRFGCFRLQIYFPSSFLIKVFPSLRFGRAMVPLPPTAGASHGRVGPRLVRQRGLGSELRELRDHTPGDPFKRIAWKATARQRRLLVREFESEIVSTNWLLLDISPTMRRRWGDRAQTKLSHGQSLCASLTQQALALGDRVGLITFDSRIYSTLPPADGRPQLYQIIDKLMETHNVVDEDLTDLTDQELYTAVATYLAYQNGIDARVQRRLTQNRSGLMRGSGGSWLDTDLIHRTVASSLAQHGGGMPRWWNRIVAGSPSSAQLRLFCRVRGIELPYRQSDGLPAKGSGLAQAIRRAARSRLSHQLLIVSDLQEVVEPRAVIDSLRLALRHHHRVVVFSPQVRGPIQPHLTNGKGAAHRRLLRHIEELRLQRARGDTRLQIERIGVPVIDVGPFDSIDQIFARLRRRRGRLPAAS
ncbi:MAG: DUF58 domain-containing protein [Deltaproteobacteria bacterium]|nr:DUF58 domain-containing protein [Deltaproteobacteria bacterium]